MRTTAAIGPRRPGQVERRVEVAVDEVGQLEAVEVGQPVAEASEGGGLGRAGARRGSRRSSPPARATPAARCRRRSRPGTWGRPGGACRCSSMSAPAAAKRVDQDAGHGQHAGPGVEPVAVGLEQPGPAARDVAPLEDLHVVAPPGQVAGGRQAPQAGPDDDDAHGPELTPALRPADLYLTADFVDSVEQAVAEITAALAPLGTPERAVGRQGVPEERLRVPRRGHARRPPCLHRLAAAGSAGHRHRARRRRPAVAVERVRAPVGSHRAADGPGQGSSTPTRW